MLRGQAGRLSLALLAAALAACARGALGELERLYETDRADRADRALSYRELERRDAERTLRVLELHEAGRLSTAREKLLASALLQHGGEGAHFLLAHELALGAAEGGIPEARWLAAAGQDLHRLSQGRPQLFGTQIRLDPSTGRWGLGEVDPSLTDAERSRWGVRPLSESLRLAEELNRDGLNAFMRSRTEGRARALVELQASSASVSVPPSSDGESAPAGLESRP